MPIYGCARLRHAMSNELKRRMQGKACFNFNKVDAKLFEELDRLTGESLIAFKAAGYLSKSK